jgi:hypothetical protein
MRVSPRFSVDGCGQNSRLLWVFKSLGVEDLTHVIIHHTDSAGLPLSPPLFFGLLHIGLPLLNLLPVLLLIDFRPDLIKRVFDQIGELAICW